MSWNRTVRFQGLPGPQQASGHLFEDPLVQGANTDGDRKRLYMAARWRLRSELTNTFSSDVPANQGSVSGDSPSY